MGTSKTAKLQLLIKEKGSFPYKPLDAVTASASEEKKDVFFIWIQLEAEFHNGCPSINPMA